MGNKTTYLKGLSGGFNELVAEVFIGHLARSVSWHSVLADVNHSWSFSFIRGAGNRKWDYLLPIFWGFLCIESNILKHICRVVQGLQFCCV